VMTPTDQAMLQAWQNNRSADHAVLSALWDECLAPPSYIRELEIVRHCMCVEESDMTFEEEDEQMLQFALVGFRTMNPEMRSAFLVGAMDEFCRMASDGEVDERLAGQLLTRAQLIASPFHKKDAA